MPHVYIRSKAATAAAAVSVANVKFVGLYNNNMNIQAATSKQAKQIRIIIIDRVQSNYAIMSVNAMNACNPISKNYCLTHLRRSTCVLLCLNWNYVYL